MDKPYDLKIVEARRIARKFRKTHVIVLMFDDYQGTIEYASYGVNRSLCSTAKVLADVAYQAIFHYLR